MRSTTSLIKLRQLMTKNALAAYIIPECDAHSSEYLAPRDKRRGFISGFTGSAGTAVVTQDKALLWTDGRYYIQAQNEMDVNWNLMKEGTPGTPTRGEWLAENIKPGNKVGVDPFLIPASEWERLESSLGSSSVILEPVERNFVDLIWGADQPDYPENPVRPLSLRYTGISWEDKVDKVRHGMKAKRADCLILSALDDTAWFLNMRGSDIPFNPIFFAYTAITHDHIYLFVSKRQVSEEVKNHLKPSKSASNIVDIQDYSDINKFLDEFCQQDSNRKVWLSGSASYGLISLVPREQRIMSISPVTLMKAIKNETEVQGFVNSHIRDAAALCCYFAWLEKNVGSTKDITEMSGAAELERIREEMDDYVGLSFDTISASGPNGAVIHYRSCPETNRPITRDELYLVDSGAQYKDGTTDVTRTMHFGTPTDFQKECFTRVLKGQMGLASIIFPNKLTGQHLDSFARAALWEVGLDYRHGTGHGVGSYLNVHEGPMGISWRAYPEDPGLQENMILSDEPGYYEDGKFGIRIENIVRVVKAKTKYAFQNTEFLTFENVTVVPIQQKMIDPRLLTSKEIDDLNLYHEKCRDLVGPLLRELGKQDGLNWLIRETEPIG